MRRTLLIDDPNVAEQMGITPGQRVRLQEIAQRTPPDQLGSALLNELTAEQRQMWQEIEWVEATDEPTDEASAEPTPTAK